MGRINARPYEGPFQHKIKTRTITGAKVTILSISRRGIKYKIHCPHCGKEIGVFYGREANWSSICQHCEEMYNVNVKIKK